MPCSKNNKNNKNKNNKKQKYNCLTNSVSHCRNTKPTPPTPPPPPNPPFYLTAEKYDVICDPNVLTPLQSGRLSNKLVRNLVDTGPDKLLSLLTLNTVFAPNKAYLYTSNYIFEFKNNFKLAFNINIFENAGYVFGTTQILGTFFVGTKFYPTPLININQPCFSGCQYYSKVQINNYSNTSIIDDNTFHKFFEIYENYQFSSGPYGTGAGSITQSALTGSDPTLLGYVETEVGLPIKLPFKIPSLDFSLNSIIFPIKFPVILTPRFYPLEPINNFLYQIDSDKIIIKDEYITEKCLAKVTGILISKYQGYVNITVKIFAQISREYPIGTIINEGIYSQKFVNVNNIYADIGERAKITTVLEENDQISLYTTIKLDNTLDTLPIQGALRNELSFTVYKEL